MTKIINNRSENEMFDSSLFNEYKLFQKLANLQKSHKNKYLDDLLYCANSALLRIIAIKKYNDKCVNEYNEIEEYLSVKNSKKIFFFSSTFVRLLNEIPVFFSDLRKMQNAFLKLLSLELNLKIKPPNSLSQAIKKGLENYDIPPDICKIIFEYWNSTGRQVKDYRDIDQHWYQIVQRTWLKLDLKRKMMVILPDSKETMTYEKNVEALGFMKKSFEDFHDMVDKTCESLGFTENVNFPLEIPMNPGVLLIPGEEKEFLIGLIAFNRGPFSGVEFGVKTTEDNVFFKPRLIPREL